jgi:hypothetical protein
VFIWQILNDKIQSAEQLKKRNWPGPIECKLYVSSFNVLLLNFVGVFVEMFFCWDYTPWIVDDLANLCTEKSNKQTQKFIFFGCITWSLWLIRNAFIFQDVAVASHNARIYRAISFMRRWKIFRREK